MALLKFLKGNYAKLNEAAINEGQILICNDTAEMFVDIAADKRIKIGDFTVVANIAALEALDATTVPTSRLYYVEEGNILARSNGTTWIQVNKQPSVAELKTLLGLGDLAYLSEVSEDNLNAALKEKVNAAAEGNHAHLNKSELDKIADGDVEKWNAAQANIIESVKVNGEALEIKDKAVDIAIPTGALAGKDEVAKLDLAEALVAEIDGKVASVAAGNASVVIGGTSTAPTVAAKISAAEGNALTLAEDGLKVIIPESTKVEVSETNGNIKVDGEEVTVYTHPEKHAMIEVDGLSDALAGKQDVIPENTYDAHGAASQALVDAKAYVDEGDIFVTDMKTINALGGIAAGSDLNNLTTHEVLKKLLYPYVDATVGNATATPNGGTYEKGATKTITQVSISITKKSEPITSVALYNGSTLIEEKTGDAVKNGGTITFTGLSVEVPTNGNQLTVKVTYPDANGNAKTVEKKTTALTFVYPYYMGSCAAGTAIDETLVESLTKKIESKGNKSNSFTVSDGHMVFAYPKAHGVLKSILDPNNFETIGNYTRSEVSVTGLDGTAQTYYVYVSGATTVSGFTVNFKY